MSDRRVPNNETVKGWKADSSDAYCEPCFRKVMEEHEKVECDDPNESGKIEVYRSKKNGLLQRGNKLWR